MSEQTLGSMVCGVSRTSAKRIFIKLTAERWAGALTQRAFHLFLLSSILHVFLGRLTGMLMAILYRDELACCNVKGFDVAGEQNFKQRGKKQFQI